MIDPHIVIVGGGPIGLYTAIQTKATNPDKKIVVLEKHQEYQRRDIRLNIEGSSFNGSVNYPPLNELTRKWKKKMVPIQKMETALTQLANKLGIQILKGEAEDPKTLLEKYPNTEVFVGADGAHSSMRKTFFNDEFRFNTKQQYIAQVQYLMKDNSQNKKTLREIAKDYTSSLFAGHFISKSVQPLKDGTFQVTLRIFVDKKTYEEINPAKLNSPYYFTTSLEKIPENLKSTLIHWWGSHPNETVIHSESNKLTAIALTSYAAKEFVKEITNKEKKVIVALVGDAAQAYPYFRAINNGFLTATSLARSLAKPNRPSLKTFRSYRVYAAFRAIVERIRAFFNNLMLNLVKLWFYIFKRSGMKTGSLKIMGLNESYQNGLKVWNRVINLCT